MKFDKLVGIGCSFTHGGGLETDIAYNYYNNTPNVKNSKKVLEEFKYRNSYIGQLAILMGGLEYENLSEGRASTEHLLHKTYNMFKNNFENTLLILQPSFCSRKLFFNNTKKEYININSAQVYNDLIENKKKYKIIDGIENNINFEKIYLDYMVYCFNHEEEQKNQYNLINVYISWLKSKNVTTIVLPLEPIFGTTDIEPIKNNLLPLDGNCLSNYMDEKKLRFSDISDMKYNDTHISIEGHKKIANKIFNYIQTL